MKRTLNLSLGTIGIFVLLLTLFTYNANAQANNCVGATALTVYTTTCGGATTGTTVGATQSQVGCTGTADDDVWYSFVAGAGGHTITVASINPGRITDIVFEVFSGTCGSLTSVLCQNATSGTANESATLTGLTVGATYYVRIYSFANGTGQGQFSICITKPAAPANDNCASSTLLTPAANCTGGPGGSQAGGSLVAATNSGVPAGSCGGTADDDVWFNFVAQYTTQTVTVSSIGSAIAVNGSGIGGSAVLQVYSSSNNTCGGVLTSIACGIVSGNNLVAYANSLTVGNTYFIRVYSTNAVSLASNANFNVCVQNPPLTSPVLFFGKSFVNVTKGVSGGTVETGDVLEIRASIVIRPTSLLDSCAFLDNVPAGTSYIPGSLAILTNEGKVYKGFTDAAGDDEGHIIGSAVRINMGYFTGDNQATATRGGRIRNNHRPVVSNSCVMIASYRVTVTAPLNSIISLGGGTFRYAVITAPTTVLTQTFNANNVIVYTNTGLCTNASGVNVLDNTIAGDFDGTFGSGNTMNRIPSPNMPAGYTYTQLTGGRPGDFEYAVVNNTSNNAAGYSTVNTWPKPQSPVVNRIFGVFDVIGDHTGASDPFAGNPAADTTNGGTGGYMLLVNSSYNLDTVFKYPISGLCPNTYYELSFWVRNICSRCGIDSVGRGASGVTVPVGYIPTDVGDSSGVYPNLSLSIDDINHYTTGSIRYTGQWVKKGFVFRTGPAQTNIVFSITNNAPGGGGNDWALDDISLSTCTPNLNLVPSGNSQVCYGNQVDLNCQVISFFNNYVYYQWQVSHDLGVTWTDTLAMGTGTPTLSGGNYVYTALFPSFLADSSQHLTQYRIRVATTPANLYSGCSFFNSANIIVMVNSCQWTLKTNLLSFDGLIKNNHAELRWQSSNENDQTVYEVQKSINGTDFFTIGKLNASATTDAYQFTDPEALSSFAYYRIIVKEPAGQKISKIVLLSLNRVPFEILSVVNPFREQLSFELSAPENSPATIIVSDQHGKAIKMIKQQVIKGMNRIQLNNLGHLSNGTYLLQVITNEGLKTKRVVKVSN